MPTFWSRGCSTQHKKHCTTQHSSWIQASFIIYTWCLLLDTPCTRPKMAGCVRLSHYSWLGYKSINKDQRNTPPSVKLMEREEYGDAVMYFKRDTESGQTINLCSWLTPAHPCPWESHSQTNECHPPCPHTTAVVSPKHLKQHIFHQGTECPDCQFLHRFTTEKRCCGWQTGPKITDIG